MALDALQLVALFARRRLKAPRLFDDYDRNLIAKPIDYCSPQLTSAQPQKLRALARVNILARVFVPAEVA